MIDRKIIDNFFDNQLNVNLDQKWQKSSLAFISCLYHITIFVSWLWTDKTFRAINMGFEKLGWTFFTIF